MNLLQLFENVQNVNLDQLYRKFNQKYFNGQLPVVKTKWSNKRRSMGAVVANRVKATGVISIKHLEISKHLDIDEEKLSALMLHEMIHVYVLFVLQLSERSGGHGTEFHKKRGELNRKTPFVIPASEDYNEFEVSPHIKIKPTVIILRTGSGGTWVHAISEKGFQKDFEKIIGRFVQEHEYEVFVSAASNITKIPVARVLTKKGMPYYRMNDKEIQLIRDGMTKMIVKIDKNGNISS